MAADGRVVRLEALADGCRCHRREAAAVAGRALGAVHVVGVFTHLGDGMEGRMRVGRERGAEGVEERECVRRAEGSRERGRKAFRARRTRSMSSQTKLPCSNTAMCLGEKKKERKEKQKKNKGDGDEEGDARMGGEKE